MLFDLPITVQIFMAALAVICGGISAMLYLMLRGLNDRSKSKYDTELNQAVLSDMRLSFEKQLADLNYQLMSSEKRWQEVNHLILSAQTPLKSEQSMYVPQKAPNRFRSVRPIANDWPADTIEKFLNGKRRETTFLSKMGIDTTKIQTQKNLVFVLTPFEPDFHLDYLAIKGACDEVGLKCVRGDEEQATGDILKHILKLIVQADFIIANISSRNPNVYYELGIAQALGKDAILVARDSSNLTFDLQSQRVLLYKNEKDLPPKLSEMLLRTFVSRTQKVN